METVVKRYFKKFAFKITTTALLINLIVSTETPADSDAAVESETMSVTVTRTGEGIEVVTPDGRHVLLKNDHTWEYLELEQLPAEQSAVLDVVNVKELSNACDILCRSALNGHTVSAVLLKDTIQTRSLFAAAVFATAAAASFV